MRHMTKVQPQGTLQRAQSTLQRQRFCPQHLESDGLLEAPELCNL